MKLQQNQIVQIDVYFLVVDELIDILDVVSNAHDCFTSIHAERDIRKPEEFTLVYLDQQKLAARQFRSQFSLHCPVLYEESIYVREVSHIPSKC